MNTFVCCDYKSVREQFRLLADYIKDVILVQLGHQNPLLM